MKHYHFILRVVVFVMLSISSLLATPQWATSADQIRQAERVSKSKQTMIDNMVLVFNVGKEVGDPEIMQAILLQETNGGRSELVGDRNQNVGLRSYGIMQVKVIAARSVFENFPHIAEKYFPDRKYSKIADEEIIVLLLSNNEANARIGAYHFKYYKSLVRGDWIRAVAGYNAGIGVAKKMKHPNEFKYVVGVNRRLTTVVKPFNRTHNLQLTR